MKIAIIIVTACLLAAVACKKENNPVVKSDVRKDLYVNARDGLRLRAAADQTGAVLDLVPYGTKVTILEEGPAIVTIGGASGRWCRVQWNGKTGWVFGGLLKNARPEDAVKGGGSGDENYTHACRKECVGRMSDELSAISRTGTPVGGDPEVICENEIAIDDVTRYGYADTPADKRRVLTALFTKRCPNSFAKFK